MFFPVFEDLSSNQRRITALRKFTVINPISSQLKVLRDNFNKVIFYRDNTHTGVTNYELIPILNRRVAHLRVL